MVIKSLNKKNKKGKTKKTNRTDSINKIDIRFVAEKAQVSPATVSRVFNRSELVTEKTRKRVLAVSKKYNYKPSYIARSMRLKNTGYIGFVMPDFDNFFYLELLKGADYYATKKNYHFVLFNYQNDNIKEMKLLDILTIRRIDGVLIGWLYGDKKDSIFIKQVINKKIPCVMIENLEEDLNVPYVGTDNAKGGSLAADYLIGLNHKKIGIITYDLKIANMKYRYLGFKNVLEDRGIKSSFCIELPAEIEVRNIKGELEKNIDIILNNNVSAIYVTSDIIAMDLLEVFKSRKIRIPEDISIISFDNITISRFLEPKLTTISVNPDLMGESLSRLLIEMIENKSRNVRKKIILDPELIIRESCRKI